MAHRNAVAGALVLAATLGLAATPKGAAQAQSLDYSRLVSAQKVQESTIARTAVPTTVPTLSQVVIGMVRVDLSIVDESGGTIGLSTEVPARGGYADTGQIEAAREAAQEAWSAFEAETPNAAPEQRRSAFEAASDPQDDAFDRIEAVRAVNAPDLVITDVRLQMLKMSPPIPMVSYRVENQWIGDAETFQVSTYLSTDGVIDPTDVLVSSATVPGLAAGAVYEEIIALPVPTGVAPGTYFLGAFADPVNEVVEANGAGTAELNNGWAGDTFTVSDQPANTDPVRSSYEGKSVLQMGDAYAGDRLAPPSDLEQRVDDASKLEQLAGDLFAQKIPGAGSDALGTDGNVVGLGDSLQQKAGSEQSGFGLGALGLPTNQRDALSQRQSQLDAVLGDRVKDAPMGDPLDGGMLGGVTPDTDKITLGEKGPEDLQKSTRETKDRWFFEGEGGLSGGGMSGDSRLMQGGNCGKICRQVHSAVTKALGPSQHASQPSNPGLTPIPTGNKGNPKLTPIPAGNKSKKAAAKKAAAKKAAAKKAAAKKAKEKEAEDKDKDKKMCPDHDMSCGQARDAKAEALAMQKAAEEARQDQQSLMDPGTDGSGTSSTSGTVKRFDSKQMMQEALNPYIIPDENSGSSGTSTQGGTPDLDPANSTLVDPPKDSPGWTPPGGGVPDSGPGGGTPDGASPMP